MGSLHFEVFAYWRGRLDEEEKTHIITRVAGTIGYMAPEYALWGYLSYKADVYSFGVVVLETVSGKNVHRQRIVNWINATDGTSSAFDITTKRILHSSLHNEYWRMI
ncbi:hypothetical protein P8452_03249 [Trifolium repens]|nr:hypothetical protein P8452_03236 [Trifolium repens]WJX12793.1 hypothetical protein P8452_03249 [Trifolium repens]